MPPKHTGSHNGQRESAAPVSSTIILDSALGESTAQLDPSLLALATTTTTGASAPLIDPALFKIEQVVNDVRRGHVRPEDLDEPQVVGDAPGQPVEEQRHDEEHPQHASDMTLDHADDMHAQVQGDGEHSHIQLDDDEIDPALREIVNSLTNAQQSHTGFTDNVDERERIDRERLQHTLQTTLEDFAQNGFGSYGGIFNTSFPETGSGRFGIPPLPEVSGESSSTKRGRGRPKGSKNKPKPNAPSPPPPPAKRPRGRPPKVRSVEEIEEMERRKQEKELGINRKRGRPRKYPEIGLVRELRLKKNRGYFAEKMAQLQERESVERGVSTDAEKRDEATESTRSEVAAAAAALAASEVSLGQQVAAAVARDDEAEHYAWPYQDGQSLLDVVGMGGMEMNQRSGMDVELPAGSMGDDDMRGVFSLAGVGQQ